MRLKKQNHTQSLKSQTQKEITYKMLASTIQFSHTTPPQKQPPHTNNVAAPPEWAHKKGHDAPDTQQCTNICQKKKINRVLITNHSPLA